MPMDRISRFCMIDETWGELMFFGAKNGMDAVQNLILGVGGNAKGQR
jgi:hypothetical protein